MPKINDRRTREIRREAAEKRQAAHSALSIQEKISKVTQRPGRAYRELTRLALDEWADELKK